MPFDTMDAERILGQVAEKVTQVRRKLVYDLGQALRSTDFDRYGPEGAVKHREEVADRLHEEARAQLTQLDAQARQARDEIARWIDEKSVEMADVQTQLLAETRKQTAWERARKRLDLGDDVTVLIAEAKDKKDLATLRGLAEEFQVWARGKNLSPTGTRDVLAAVGRAVAEATPGSAGVAARMRIKMAEQVEDVSRALSEGRAHVDRLANDPMRALRRAELMLDIEKNGVGMSVTNGTVEQHGRSRSGGDFSEGNAA